MNIVVLAGGTSTERDVSLVSGKMVYEALKAKGHNAILLDVFLGYEGSLENIFTREEDWTVAAGNTGLSGEKLFARRADHGKRFFGPNVIDICEMADCVFFALHGENGEDGKIQACFELMGIPYTGTDHVSSAIAMDKGITKDLFKAYDIPTPAGIRVKKGDNTLEKIPYPAIVKVCCGGSSVGVYIVNNDEEYENAKIAAFEYGDEVVVEQYIEGREFSVAVIDGKAMPVVEIAPKAGFYDYQNKYEAGRTVETCPAELSAEKTAELQRISEKVYKALRLCSYARMDFRMNDREEVFCLEANTLPGMTPTSLLPQEAAAIGIDFGGLCELIIENALRERK